MSGYRLTPAVRPSIVSATAGSRPYGDSLLASTTAPGDFRPGTYAGSSAIAGRSRTVTAYSLPYELLEVAAPFLFTLDRFEQGFEVALSEALGAVPLDQLEEDGRPILHRLGEDLQQVAVLV